MRRFGIVIMQYRSTAPPLPGPPPIEVSEVLVRIGIELADLPAA
jgi:hypothetical protein